MAFIIKDRVKEGTTTTGTGALTLGGSSATFEPFNSYMSNGDTTYYAVVHTTSGVDEWEVGLGTWNTGNTLTRTTVLSGSNGTSAVDFASGTKDVFMTYPAAAAATLDVDSNDLAATVTFGNHTTADLPEGASLYYTDARVDAHLSGGTGVTYNAGAISIGQAVGTGDAVTFNGVTSDLTGNADTATALQTARTIAGKSFDGTANITIAAADLSDVDQAVATTSNVTFNNITSTGTVTLSADPSAALGAATKQYVDTIASAGIHYHDPVRVEHPSNLNATYNNGSSGVGATLTNAGTNAALVLDGVSMVLNDRTLVANQTDQTQNGVYKVTTVGDGSTAWVLTRSTDTDSSGPSDPDALGKGDAFFIKEGTNNAGHLDVLTTAGTITFGTTNIHFAEVAETSIYSAGNSLTLTGTAFDTIQDIRTTATPTFAGVTAPLTGNASTATTLQTARNIGGVSFDGSANINLAGVNTAGNQDTSGNAATATALETARTIGGVSFDGTANITLPGVNSAGNQSTSGNAATATALATARNIALAGDVVGNANFDGTGNISITAAVQDDSHAHVISNVDGLQTALNAKADDSTTFTAGNGLTGGGTLGANRTFSIGAGGGITVTADAVAHSDTSLQSSLTALTGANVVSDIDLDTYGHVTNLATRTMTLANLGYTGATNANNYVHPSHPGDDFSIDTGALSGATVISDLDINVTTDTLGHVTDANATVSTRNLTLADLGYTGATNANNSTSNATHTGEVTGSTALTIADNVVDAGNLKVTGNGTTAQFLRSDGDGSFTWATPTDTNTVYTHPTHPGDDFSVDTGALTGATVVSDIDINVTTDSLGHVTDANGSVATRTLTLADLGYTGATNANYITNNNQLSNGAGYITSSGSITGNAGSVDGFSATQTRNTANTIPVRNSSGYLELGWINTTSGDTTSALSRVYVDTGDGYIRKCTLAHLASQGGFAGDITGVTAGTNLDGGGTSGTVTLNVSSNPSFTDVYVADQILHTGDTNTYMQFHAGDQWRVVVGGSERLEVKNSSPHVLVSGDLNSTSDERLKDNIKPIENALSDVCRLEGVSFNWKDTGTKATGFIAQQVEPILPDLVNTNEDDGIKSVNYIGLIGHLVEAIKEQQVQIDELKAQLNS
jgi:hypothetical protein